MCCLPLQEPGREPLPVQDSEDVHKPAEICRLEKNPESPVNQPDDSKEEYRKRFWSYFEVG